MADNTFDFRLSQPVYAAALEEYRKMETVLEEEMEKQKENVDNLQQQWKGEAAESLQDGFSCFLEEGAYKEAYAAVKAMHRHMEGCLPEIKALLARCEGFPDQLESDAYVEPPKPAGWQNSSINGGILSINYSRATDVMDACDRVLEKNRKLTAELEDVIRGCSGLLEGTEEDLEALAAASRKLDCTANYRDSLQAYKTGIEMLELEMELRLSSLSDNRQQVQKDHSILGLGRATGKKIDWTGYYSNMDEEELGVLLENLQNDGNTVRIRRIAYGIFAKDTDKWTDTDAEFIARTWDYAIQSQNVELIEEYTKRLMAGEYLEQKESFVYEETEEGEEVVKQIWTSKYQITGDAERLQLVMDRLDPKTQGEAYYTLNRLNNLAIDSIQITGDTMEELTGLGYCDVKASVEGGLIRLEVYAQAESGGYPNKGTAHNGFTVYDMGKVIDTKAKQKLWRFKYDADEIERLRLSILTDTDVEFAGKFYAGNYEDAFLVDPDGMSEKMFRQTAKFLIKLEEMESVSAGTSAGMDELTAILNVLLYEDADFCPEMPTYHHDKYLNNITDELKLLANETVLAIRLGVAAGYRDERLAVMIEEGNQYYNQYSLWEAVRHLYNLDLNLNYIKISQSMRDNGWLYLQISNLQAGEDGSYSFLAEEKDPSQTIFIETQELEQYYKVSVTHPDAQAVWGDVLAEDRKKLEKEKNMLPVNAVLDVLADVLGGIDEDVPLDLLVTAPRELLAEDAEGLFDGIAELSSDKILNLHETISSLGIPGAVAADLFYGVSCYGEIMDEMDSNWKQTQINYFGQYTRMHIEYVNKPASRDGEHPYADMVNQYIGCQLITAKAAYNMSRLERDGIEVYLEEAFDPDERAGMSDEEYRQCIEEMKEELRDANISEDDGWTILVEGKGKGHMFQPGYLDPISQEFVSCEKDSILLTNPQAVFDGINNIRYQPNNMLGEFGRWINGKEE